MGKESSRISILLGALSCIALESFHYILRYIFGGVHIWIDRFPGELAFCISQTLFGGRMLVENISQDSKFICLVQHLMIRYLFVLTNCQGELFLTINSPRLVGHHHLFEQAAPHQIAMESGVSQGSRIKHYILKAAKNTPKGIIA